MEGSGCTRSRSRAYSFAEWEDENCEGLEEHRHALRPFLTLFCLLEGLTTKDSSLVALVEQCQRASSLEALLRQANLEMDDALLLETFEKGRQSIS